MCAGSTAAHILQCLPWGSTIGSWGICGQFSVFVKKKEEEKLEKERLEAEKKRIPDLNVPDADKVFNQENFNKLLENQEKLSKYVIGKDVEAARSLILDEIKEIDPQEYEEQKDNHSQNELMFLLKGLRKGNPKQNDIPNRNAGAKQGGIEKPEVNTQIDTVLNKAVSG